MEVNPAMRARRGLGIRSVAMAAASVLVAACGWLPGTVRTFPVTVDNQLDEPAILEITEFGPPAAGGLPPALAEPVVVPPGEHVVHLPDPRDQWSLWLRGHAGSYDGSELREWSAQVQRGELRVVRIVIGPDGLSAETSQ